MSVLNSPIRIGLVDDQKQSLERLHDLFSFFADFEIIWMANSGTEALAKLSEAPPQILLLDLEMPNMSGIEVCRALRSSGFNGKILMLTISDTAQHLKSALSAGADGYILKGERPEILMRMLQDSLEGRLAFSAEMAQQTLNLARSPLEEDHKLPEDFNLSKRELQVLEKLVKGATYTDIANQLIISPLTVRSHMENIYRKLEVHNKANAINLALKNRWF